MTPTPDLMVNWSTAAVMALCLVPCAALPVVTALCLAVPTASGVRKYLAMTRCSGHGQETLDPTVKVWNILTYKFVIALMIFFDMR